MILIQKNKEGFETVMSLLADFKDDPSVMYIICDANKDVDDPYEDVPYEEATGDVINRICRNAIGYALFDDVDQSVCFGSTMVVKLYNPKLEAWTKNEVDKINDAFKKAARDLVINQEYDRTFDSYDVNDQLHKRLTPPAFTAVCPLLSAVADRNMSGREIQRIYDGKEEVAPIKACYGEVLDCQGCDDNNYNMLYFEPYTLDADHIDDCIKDIEDTRMSMVHMTEEIQKVSSKQTRIDARNKRNAELHEVAAKRRADRIAAHEARNAKLHEEAVARKQVRIKAHENRNTARHAEAIADKAGGSGSGGSEVDEPKV